MKLLALLLLVLSSGAFAQEVTICRGDYALCAASTCTKTGKTITLNDGKSYPEVLCKCPIMNGLSIAVLTMGKMQGTCVPGAGEVWSLFAPRILEGFHYPQETNNFVRQPRAATKAQVQSCPAALAATSANCFAMPCKIDAATTNGTRTATCSCPIGQLAKGTDYLTEAGQGNPKACHKHPVSAPIPQLFRY